ncbi:MULTISPECIES: hypothetical protein [unclassified Bordetella]|uniref:hypothetical protein n=1 Tax=unclassified Bordetella TaxID=2630031 RepID=UPI0013212F82|nr:MULTISPECIES: hypothetical protein [unclassified Bordetella]MVW72550.1 hypothetical protein [Bordetella sp. 15P40C-2]MVW78538.1 hypothetical protein [Bordetella sp. 02P26C-1]
MRHTLDCAVLITPAHTNWAREWVDRHRGQLGRLRLYVQDVSSVLLPSRGGFGPISTNPVVMRRFDGCLLPVSRASLSWTRTLLVGLNAKPCVPLIALLFDITAPATLDLLSLGINDFVRDPVCPDELRARLLHSKRQARAAASVKAATTSSGIWTPTNPSSAAKDPAERRRRSPVRAIELVERPSIVGVTGRAPGATGEDAEYFDVRAIDEPFRQAKARVVAGFERAYLRGALYRHSGNVARAARAACKHRRAFWALMRKHRIDAAHFRMQETTPEPVS